jgi:hypothetical protein
MATMTMNAFAVVAAHFAGPRTEGPSLFSRLVQSVAESRQAKADIETRRVLSMLDRNTTPFEYSLLPFRGE